MNLFDSKRFVVSPLLVLVLFVTGSPSVWHFSHDDALSHQPAPSKAEARASRFDWPVNGPISNLMTDEHPLGIDIGLTARPDSVIRSVEDGTVVFAGGRTCCGYGLYVMVEHRDGLTTVYAHLSQVDVEEGDEVSRSQPLGVSGATGASRGEHLHFEVRDGRERLDPMTFLPQPCPFVHSNRDYTGYAMIDGDCAGVPHQGVDKLRWPLKTLVGGLLAGAWKPPLPELADADP